MSDLISRESVLQTIDWYAHNTYLDDRVKDLTMEIKNMPSVQIVRCKDCKYFELSYNELAKEYEVAGCYRLKKLGEEDPLLTHGDGFCSWAVRREE